MRIAVLDSDTGFVQVLANRAEGMGWDCRRLEVAPDTDELAAMRISALVVDLTVLGPRAWSFLEEVATAVPALAIVVATERSSVAQRVRGLRLGDTRALG